jgi:hypothetical protein
MPRGRFSPTTTSACASTPVHTNAELAALGLVLGPQGPQQPQRAQLPTLKTHGEEAHHPGKGHKRKHDKERQQHREEEGEWARQRDNETILAAHGGRAASLQRRCCGPVHTSNPGPSWNGVQGGSTIPRCAALIRSTLVGCEGRGDANSGGISG